MQFAFRRVKEPPVEHITGQDLASPTLLRDLARRHPKAALNAHSAASTFDKPFGLRIFELFGFPLLVCSPTPVSLQFVSCPGLNAIEEVLSSLSISAVGSTVLPLASGLLPVVSRKHLISPDMEMHLILLSEFRLSRTTELHTAVACHGFRLF